MTHRTITIVIVFFVVSQCTFMFMPSVLANDSTIHSTIEQRIEMATLLIQDKEIEQAKEIIEFELQKSEKELNLHNKAILEYLLADCFYFEHNFAKAKSIYVDVKPIFEQFNDTLFLVRTINSIGLLYSFENNNTKTMDYYLKAIDLINKIEVLNEEMLQQKLITLSNIINFYNRTNESIKAINFAPEAIKIANQLKDSTRLGLLYNTLGIAYKKTDNPQQAILHYKKAGDIYLKQNDQFSYSFVINNIACLHDEYFTSDSAFYYFALALDGFENENYPFGIAKSLIGLASVRARNNEYQKAVADYERVITIAIENQFHEIHLSALFELSEFQYKNGQYKQAYDLINEYRLLNDSLHSIEVEKEIADLKTQYEVSLMESELSLLKTENLKHEYSINRKAKQVQAAITFIIFLLIIIYIVYFYYQQKIKANKKLAEKNLQIEKQNEELTKINREIDLMNTKLQQSRHELIVSNHLKNRFFSVLAHDLQSPFHNLLGFSHLLSVRYDLLNAEERKNMANDIYQSCMNVNRLLENLLEWNRTQTKEITFSPQTIQLSSLINNVVEVLQCSADNKNIKINIDVPVNQYVDADQKMLESIFRNLINNSIKFTNPGGTIKVSTHIEDHTFKASIEDNGVGIDRIHLNKLFRIDSKLKTDGTSNEKGTGLGLVICSEFINYHQGKIWVESEKGKGSTFSFSIPQHT